MLSDERANWKIASRLEKKPLLIAVNCLAGLAIFFFGESTTFFRVNDFHPYWNGLC